MSTLQDLQKKRIEDMENPKPLPTIEIHTDDFQDACFNSMAMTYWMDGSDENLNNGAIDLHDGTTMDDGPENSVRDEGFQNDGPKAILSLLDTYRLLERELEKGQTRDGIIDRIKRIVGEKYEIKIHQKSFRDMMAQTFIRGSPLNDAVVARIVCTPQEELVIRKSLTEEGRNQELRDNGFLGVQDDLFLEGTANNESWPVLKLYLPACSYLYWTGEERESEDWIRMSYGIQIEITGPEFVSHMNGSTSPDSRRKNCIDKTTREFLACRPLQQLCNLELMIAFCRLLSKNGSEGDFLDMTKVREMMEKRKILCKEEGIELKCSIELRNKKIDMWATRLRQIVNESSPKYDGLLFLELQQ